MTTLSELRKGNQYGHVGWDHVDWRLVKKALDRRDLYMLAFALRLRTPDSRGYFGPRTGQWTFPWDFAWKYCKERAKLNEFLDCQS